MNKNAESYGLMVLAVVAVVAVIGLVTYFGNQTMTGAIPAPFESKSWSGTEVSEEREAYNLGLSVAAKDCADNILEASKSWTENINYLMGVECGKCCEDSLGKTAEMSDCAWQCTSELKRLVYAEQTVANR